MRFVETEIEGVHVVEVERLEDERGFFARTWSARALSERGLDPRVVEASVSFNRHRATLRGMHYQADPHGETKLVRCTRGAIWDVALDLRVGSQTFCRAFGVELTADNHRALYVPPACAHGFVTLQDDAEVVYMIAPEFVPQAARGVRWDDPAFAIQWPIAPVVMSARDRSYPDFVR